MLAQSIVQILSNSTLLSRAYVQNRRF